MYKYFSVLLVLGLVAISFAGTIHVPADYPTIQQAINAAFDGDIILVAPGTYNISSMIWNDRVNNLQLIGSREEDGSNASIINAAVNPGTYVAIKFFGVNGCTISGFEVKNAHSGISLENCKSCLITKNYIHDNDQASAWHGDGIEIFRSENIDVTFNIIDHNEFHGIELQYQVKNINIINNTILQTYGNDGIVLYDYLENVTIKNNIIAYSSEEGIELVYLWQGSPVNFINDYNCFWQNGAGPIRSPFTIGPHSVLADPLLVDMTNHDYYLQPNSPCVGAGEGGVFIGALGVKLVAAKVEYLPRFLNKNFKLGFTAAFIELPDPFNVHKIDNGSISITAIEGQQLINPIPAKDCPWLFVDQNRNDKEELIVFFSRSKMIEAAGDRTGWLDFTLSGSIEGKRFQGCDSIRVFSWRCPVSLEKSDEYLEELASIPFPIEFELGQNYPNPFNLEACIDYQLPEETHTTIKIYNLRGQEIKTLVDEQKHAGYHRIRWDGRDNSCNLVVSGTYLYQITAGDFVAIKKLVVLK